MFREPRKQVKLSCLKPCQQIYIALDCGLSLPGLYRIIIEGKEGILIYAHRESLIRDLVSFSPIHLLLCMRRMILEVPQYQIV